MTRSVRPAALALAQAIGAGGPGGMPGLSPDEPPVCEGSAAAPRADCEPGHCIDGEECRPIFDDCAGDEVPLVGCRFAGGPVASEAQIAAHGLG